MSVTIQVVAASDLIDNGRTKFNANDTAIAAANDAVVAQLSAHVGAGHPAQYYSKAEIDAAIASKLATAGVVRFMFRFDSTDNKSYFCGTDGMPGMIPAAGSVTRVRTVELHGANAVVVFAAGTYAVAAGDKLTIEGGPNLVVGSDIIPYKAGIILHVTGPANNHDIVVYAAKAATFDAGSGFAIIVEVTLT